GRRDLGFLFFCRCVLGVAHRQDDLGVAEQDDVAVLQRGLVDPLAVDDGSLGRPEIDDGDLVRSDDLDDGMHAANRFVLLDTQVRRGQLADLDGRLDERFGADEIVAPEDAERQRYLRGLAIHVWPPGPGLAARLRSARLVGRHRSSADFTISRTKSVRTRIRLPCSAKGRALENSPVGLTSSPWISSASNEYCLGGFTGVALGGAGLAAGASFFWASAMPPVAASPMVIPRPVTRATRALRIRSPPCRLVY